mgnify:CR=1 FL=1
MKIFLLILFVNFLSFADSSKVIEKALDEKVYNSYVWKSLIHSRNGKPSIKDKSFLLSSNNFSLKNELILNIQSIYTDIEYKCKFPARYNWLTNKYPHLRIINNSFQCKNFNEYLTKTNASSLDLIFVSENIKNPSSMMGHIFFKINGFYNRKKRSNAVSFFTEVNHLNIPVLAYESIIKGMPGYFILRPYEKQISSYINNEERNIWEYRLNLSKEQLTLIYYHLWELKDINLTYFFTGFNCATIIDNILSITSESYYSEKPSFWTTPKNVINKANRFEIITTTNMIPSLEWTLYMLSDNIGSKQIKNLKMIIDKKNIVYLERLIKKKELSKLETEFIENYTKYLFIKKDSISYGTYKNIISLIKEEDKNSIDFSNYKNPINSLDKKQLSIGSIKKEKENFFELNLLLAGNTISDDNRNYFAENSLKIGNINLLTNESSLFLNRFDFYEIKSYLPINDIIKPLSTEIGISYYSKFNNLYIKDGLVINAGAGLTNKITPDMFLYYLINSKIYMNKDYSHLTINPKIGLNIYEVLNMKTIIQYEYEYNIIKDDYSYHNINFTQSLNIDNKYRIDLDYTLMKNKNKEVDIFGLKLSYFF